MSTHTLALLAAALAVPLMTTGEDSFVWATDTRHHAGVPVASQDVSAQPDADQKGILVEVFLAPDHREDIPAIKRDLAEVSVTRVRAQVFRLGHPPKNIAIGRDVPVSVAQLAIRLAVEYNGGVELLLPQYRFFPSHVVIGSSAFDETSQIPITPEDLTALRDPTLTDDTFHTLYRRLTGEEQRRPTYLE